MRRKRPAAEYLHVKVFGTECDHLSLANPQLLKQVMAEAVEAVGMQMMGEPVLHSVELELEKLVRSGVKKNAFEDEGGESIIAAAVVTAGLTTSHAGLHTWPLRQVYHFDLYSCRKFAPDELVDILRGRLGGAAELFDLTQAFADAKALRVKDPSRKALSLLYASSKR